MRERTKLVLKTLTTAVRRGAMTGEQGRGMVSLLRFGGAIDSVPDAVVQKMFRGEGKTVKKPTTKSPASVQGGAKVNKLLNGARVKDASERLSDRKMIVKNPRTGNPLTWGAKTLETASERDTAIIGVWFKHMLRKQGAAVTMSEWEKSLLAEVVAKGRWVGDVPGRGYYGGGADPSDHVPNHMVKALLDDTVSGGISLNPVEFDSAVITYPLLHGELFPLVDVVPVTARRIMLPTIQNLTVQWGTNPGTAITPFNTSSLVGEVDTPIWAVSGAIEIDNYLLADSPVNIGAVVTQLYGERLKAELDKVIVVGNGYNQPLGVTLTSGLVTVTSDNSSGGPPTVSDYEGLIFSLAKQYRDKNWNCAFCANDTTYRRVRGINVGPGDERRVMGMDHQRYEILDYPYKIENDIPNNKILFGAWKKYRMYQRLGSEVVVTREGRALQLANTTLVVIRGRFGGQPVDPAAFALMTNAQS